MQIVVNTRLLLKDRLEGIGWFSYQVLKRLSQRNPKVHFVFLFDRNFDEDFVFSDNVTPLILSPQARHPFLYYAWLQFSVKGLLNRMKPDLFFSPDGFLALGAKCPQLPVIHDINFLHYPEHSKWLTARYYNHFFPRFASAASRIITVSEFSKRDIAKNYHLDSEKIDVVYNGINPFFRRLTQEEKKEAQLKYASGRPYFLYVGSMHPRKNIASLIKAFTHFKSENSSDAKLILCGPPFWGQGEIKEALKNNTAGPDILFTGRLPDEELALLMGGALSLMFVPLYEGFGIPAIEAMEAGVPVIASNVSSLPEVCGEAALYTNPTEIKDISGAMREIYFKPQLREQLIAKGMTQKQKFSWDKTADLVWQSVCRVTGKPENNKL